jgi:hypothetical protein
MPRISYFFGISVCIFHNDHDPPHFHAVYNDYGGAVDIRTGEVVRGTLPPRVLRLVREGAQEHRDELLNDWEHARRKEELQRIAPLE